MEYRFTVLGDPVAKARPKFRTVTTKSGKTFGSAYTPKKSTSFENLVKTSFSAQVGAVVPTELGVKLKVTAYFMPPQATPKYRKELIRTTLVPVLKKPDIDNVVKSVLDALNQVVYQDDKQVYSMICNKFFSFRPRTEVTIITEDELETAELPF